MDKLYFRPVLGFAAAVKTPASARSAGDGDTSSQEAAPALNVGVWAANLSGWGTSFTAKAHVGHSRGNGPNGTSLSPTGNYCDWSLGAEATLRNLTLGADISRGKATNLNPSFSKGQDGTRAIADATVVLSLTAAF